jgi:hypothetical protein
VQQNIAPSMLIVDGKPSPCLCRAEGTIKITCEYCIQANLILWERGEAHGPKVRPGRLINTLKKLKQRHTAEVLGVSDRTVRNLLKTNKIPRKYAQRFYRGIEKGIAG